MPEKDEHNSGPLAEGIELISHFVMDVPDSVGEVVWRVCSVIGVSALLISCFLLWRFPDQLARRLDSRPGSVAHQIESDKGKAEEVMTLVSAFIHRQRPARFAVVSWPLPTTGEVVWSSTSVQTFPVSIAGMLDPELIPAVGPMVFGECWTGELIREQWHLCPISSGSRVWGFVIAQWPAPAPSQGVRALDHLAERLESLLY